MIQKNDTKVHVHVHVATLLDVDVNNVNEREGQGILYATHATMASTLTYSIQKLGQTMPEASFLRHLQHQRSSLRGCDVMRC